MISSRTVLGDILMVDVPIGLKCTLWAQMYALGSNVRSGLKCTLWAQMYALGSNVRSGLKCRLWAQMYALAGLSSILNVQHLPTSKSFSCCSRPLFQVPHSPTSEPALAL